MTELREARPDGAFGACVDPDDYIVFVAVALRCSVALAAFFLRRLGRRLRQRVPIRLGGICLFCRLAFPIEEVALRKWTRS